MLQKLPFSKNATVYERIAVVCSPNARLRWYQHTEHTTQTRNTLRVGRSWKVTCLD